MVATSRTDERWAALRFCLVALGCCACLIGWLALASFDTADPPSTTVWPTHADPVNWCGRIGAWLAFQAFTWLGAGAWPLLALLNVAVIAAARPRRFGDLWLRFLGLLMICTATAALAAIYIAPSERHLITGPGGITGTVAAAWLLPNLQTAGSLLLLSLAILVGLILAADTLLVAFFRWMLWAGESSAPVIARGSVAVAHAGVSAAAGLAARMRNKEGQGDPPAPSGRPSRDGQLFPLSAAARPSGRAEGGGASLARPNAGIGRPEPYLPDPARPERPSRFVSDDDRHFAGVEEHAGAASGADAASSERSAPVASDGVLTVTPRPADDTSKDGAAGSGAAQCPGSASESSGVRS
ncbi:MAG: DNA translocase FtsK 4TM domain-containing protein, partial [Planctomycetota bacterium]